MKLLGKAIDEIRAEESRRLRQKGYEPVLKAHTHLTGGRK
jgi:hypothetical protein